ncbi:MAG: MltA domain-containing protein, partial [Myxococcales bacterium]|nr:MltA domain-containing protein [Myxococcales bacterium]
MSRAAFLALAVVGCASSTARAQLQPVAAEPMTVGCDDLPLLPLGEAIERELPAVTRARPDYARGVLEPILRYARADDRAHLCGALQYSMKWMHVGADRVLFTAYHTPTVRGSLRSDSIYRYPIYRRPKDAGARYTT